MTDGGNPPRDDEFELTLLGPGYGESIVMHVGEGAWVLVDSCGRTDAPAALEYLETLGVDPGEAVKLIVASHWHDDHIRGIGQMAAVCRKAKFCCSNVLCADEFLGVVHALDNRHFAASSSGVREIYSVFCRLRETGGVPTWAVANRRVFVHGSCRVWALSPSDDAFVDFMRAMSPLLPRAGQAETRIPSRSPNEVAVALRIEVGDIAVLLGADLEQRGWLKILEDEARPSGTASAFKVSHHGSESADEPAVWEEMLDVDPVAILTPWRRGNRTLPTNRDVRRILGRSSDAYATAKTAWFVQLAGAVRSSVRLANPGSDYNGRQRPVSFDYVVRSLRTRNGRSNCWVPRAIWGSTFRVTSVRAWPRTLVREPITVDAFAASGGPRSGCRLRGESRVGVEVQSPSRNRGS